MGEQKAAKGVHDGEQRAAKGVRDGGQKAAKGAGGEWDQKTCQPFLTLFVLLLLLS